MVARKIEAETGYGSTRHAKYDPEQRYDYECMKAMKNFHKPSGIVSITFYLKIYFYSHIY